MYLIADEIFQPFGDEHEQQLSYNTSDYGTIMIYFLS